MKKTILLLLCAVAAVACGGKDVTANAKETATTTTAAAKKFDLPPDHPAIGQSGAMTAPAPVQTQAPAAANLVSGTVVETMNSGGYTYVKLKTDRGDVWAAVQQTTVKSGAAATVNAQLTLDDFESKSLNRKFDHIIFGTIAGGSAPQPAATTAAASQHMTGGTSPISDVKVAKAEGPNGRTIAEVYANKAQLKDATVTIRGTVVKFLPEIMGKNWMHLRDGSGSAGKGDNDVTVTTKGTAKVGDVVVVTGALRVDKDFGAGYKYPVIVEDAKVTK